MHTMISSVDTERETSVDDETNCDQQTADLPTLVAAHGIYRLFTYFYIKQ